jgi:hypothetical protein
MHTGTSVVSDSFSCYRVRLTKDLSIGMVYSKETLRGRTAFRSLASRQLLLATHLCTSSTLPVRPARSGIIHITRLSRLRFSHVVTSKSLMLLHRYCDGLRGPLVIYDKQNDPHLSLYDIDDETTVITLADWYHNVSAKVELPFLNDATLINGQGRAFNASLRTNTSLAVINVVQGKKYRLRIINIACDPNYIFSIDGHTFQVIEADGNSHKALTVDSLQIFAAQRYSVILNANQTIGNYCTSAIDCFDARSLTNIQGSARFLIVIPTSMAAHTMEESTPPSFATKVHRK